MIWKIVMTVFALVCFTDAAIAYSMVQIAAAWIGAGCATLAIYWCDPGVDGKDF